MFHKEITGRPGVIDTDRLFQEKFLHGMMLWLGHFWAHLSPIKQKIPQAEFNRSVGNYRIKKYHRSTQEQK
jgi:hypothetical protein